MALINLPNKFWRPLAEVKNFVERMPHGVRLPQMSQKVKSFAELSRKDKDILIRYLNERDCINVIQARPTAGGNLTTFFFHQKHGLPDRIDGFDWDGIKPKITMPVEEATKADIPSPAEPEVTEEDDAEDVEETSQVDDLKNELFEKLPNSEIREVKSEMQMASSPDGNQAEDLRKRALEMLMQADKADQSRLSQVLTDIKPKITEFIDRLNKANDNVQSTLDTLYDQLGEVDKISMEFKNYCENL
ncbi:hypothetical protein F3J37_01385 [Pantoea sp. Al-1710]|uniref:Uncharacterized protein n=1 Tax=Candidatus Pantoea communis TaxID=2608354 RepID=A0ABX0RI55_9GAMM|nr:MULTISPECIES: hypothetical protein [Pantoea]NIG12969.1 hypothetical protein [Pantoea sp. Cy-640]NIG17330.1 hypothetical protein [Pantoea communis]